MEAAEPRQRMLRVSGRSAGRPALTDALARRIPAFRDRSILLTSLSVLGVASGLVIAALLSRDPREAAAYAIACVMIGGAMALGVRARETDDAAGAEGAIDPLEEAHEHMRGIAHDLKAPLLTVTSYLELIADGTFGSLSEEARAAIQRAAAVSQRAQTIVDSTLTRPLPAQPWSRDARRVNEGIEPPPTQVDLNRTLSDVLAALNSPMRERSVTVAVQGRLPAVLGDDASMFRIVENLVQNAIKFCPGDTIPRIGICSRRLDAHAVEISISDNGPGIPADVDQLIHRGARGTNASGTAGHGLGLATVTRLVTRMGGTVRFDTPAEGGTTVRLTLPAA